MAISQREPGRFDTIYFIREGKSGPIKIGYTSGDPKVRLERCQTGNPRRLRLMPSRLAGTAFLEGALHAHLAEHRLCGEWFRPVPEVLEIATGQVSAEALTERLGAYCHWHGVDRTFGGLALVA